MLWKKMNDTSVNQQFCEMEILFLSDVNTTLNGKIRPISKINDLDANQWFDIANLLLRYNIVLSHYAKQIGIEMAQKQCH